MDSFTYADFQTQHPELFINDTDPNSLTIILDENLIKQWQDEKRRELTLAGAPLEWADIGIVFRDPYTLIVRDLVRFPTGEMAGYTREFNPDFLQGGFPVVILPLSGDKILLLEQFRHSTRSWEIELPRGFAKAGLSLEENTRKELLEETNLEALEIVPIGEYYNNTGVEGNEIHLVLAKIDPDLLAKQGRPGAAEGIKNILQVAVEDLETMIMKSIIKDGFTIAAYTRAKLLGYL